MKVRANFTLMERLALHLHGYIRTTNPEIFIVRCHRCHHIYSDIRHQNYPKSHFECPQCENFDFAPKEVNN